MGNRKKGLIYIAKKKKDFLTRTEQEKAENLETQDVDVPEARFQDKQQSPDTMDGAKAMGPESSFSKKKVDLKGSSLKQEVAARVVDNGVGGEVPSNSAPSTRGLSYGGNEGTILDSAAYTPIAGQSRSDSRTGKKLDAVAKKLNFIPSEQVEIAYDESKPLAENKDAVQGYNGSPRNTNARSQKNNGFVPGELLFERSVDEIKRDQLYFSTGQVVKRNGVYYGDTPDTVPVKDPVTGVYRYTQDGNYTLNRGNYLHKAMRIRFNANGKLTKMTFDVLDCSSTSADDTVLNDAAANSTIDMNYAEMDRQKMDHKAGDEAKMDTDGWTPLARAVKQPTKTVGYLRDIENITGSEVFMAYKKTAACMSYQLNRAAKDGMKLITPMAEACCGLKNVEKNSKQFSNYTTNDIFSTDEYKKGAASLFIEMNDSVGKYKNKADILIQPRSFKLALQTADNNMNPLRLKSDFVKVVNSREVFSTIDREYDPTMPVMISDRASIIHCYNFNDLYAFEKLDEDGYPVFTKNPFIYAYNERMNSYVVAAAIPLLRGLHKYLDSVGPKIVSIDKRPNEDGPLANVDITIPMVHSTCFFSLWSLFVLSATPFITMERVNSLRDVLYYENSHEYPFHQLISIKEANPMNAINYGNPDYQLPLVVKRMQPAAALTWVLPEVFWPFDETATAHKYVLPWYFNEVDYDFWENKVKRSNGKYSMSMPSIRSGIRFGYLDDIYSMSERDVRLSLDRLVDMLPNYDDAGNQGVYKYGQNNDGIPFMTIVDSQFTPQSYLSLPRELGWFIVAPAGILSQVRDVDDSEHDHYIGNNDALFGQTSYIIKYWHGRRRLINNEEDPIENILDPTSLNVDRSTAYVQDWDAYPATRYVSDDYTDWGMLFSINDCVGLDEQIGDDKADFLMGKGGFIPFTNGVLDNGAQTAYTDKDHYKVYSLQKALWTRLQKLPFCISPFDMRLKDTNAHNDGKKFDPYDMLYYFGLVGFKASEYDEDVYNRSMDVINKGFTFLEDPFIVDSPLFKEAGLSTQSDNPDSLLH